MRFSVHMAMVAMVAMNANAITLQIEKDETTTTDNVKGLLSGASGKVIEAA